MEGLDHGVTSSVALDVKRPSELKAHQHDPYNVG
jgi:hypothetical protein